MAAEAATGPATFPIGDCGARLIESDIVHEYVFAEFKEANRTIDELPIPLVLLPATFLLPVAQLSQPQAMTLDAGSFGSLASASALEAFGGVPANRVFDKDLSDLQEPVVPEVKVGDVTQLLNTRGGTVRLPGGQAQLELDDDAVADLTAGRPTMVLAQSKRKGKGTVPVTLVPPPPDAATEPLQTVYRVGPAETFIRNPYVRAVDGSSIRVDLTAHQLQALHDKGETKLHLNGQSVTLEAGDETPVAASYALEAAPAIETPGLGTVVVDVAPVRVETTEAKPVEPEKPKSKPVGQLKLALYMPWRHTWKLKGYTRGELLHALALAPQEEVNVEVSTWDRRRRAYEDTAESEFEQTKEFTETQKDSHAVVKEMANQNTFGINIGGSVGFTQAGFNVTGTQGADARTSLNNSSKTSVETMAESVRRSTMKLRLQRQTKIAETTELGTEDKISRRIRNPNLCHTLQLNYYEVLANYDIEITFSRAEARLCVLIDNEELGLQEFDYTNIRYFESVLKRVLLVPSLESGFEAAHRLYAQDQLCEARRRNDMCSGVEKLAKKPSEDEEALTGQVERIVKSYGAMHTAGPMGRKRLSEWSILSGAFGLPGLVWTMDLIDTQEFQRWLYRVRARQLEPHLFDLLAVLHAERSKPGYAGATLDQVHDVIDALAAVPDLSKLKGSSFVADGDTLYQILRETFGIKPFEIFNDIPPDAYAVNDCGVVAGLTTLREMVADLAEKKAKEDAVDAMAENQAAALATLAAKDTAADLEAVEALRTHLNSYRNYYRAAIFQLMPWSDAFQQAIAPYYPLVGREVLGFSGNSLALPVNVELDKRLQAFFDELVTNNPELISMKSTMPVTLPTSGVHLENRLGTCSGCEEYVEQIRELDLESKKQSLEQQKLENERYRARLDAKDYHDPVRRPPLVRIEEDGQPGAVPPAGPPEPPET
jgi:hypothetical protein